MTPQAEFNFEDPTDDAGFLKRIFERADRILIKKLSNNDRDWARFSNKHQAGVYMPVEQRDGGFFLPLETMARDDADADEIRERFFATYWPQVGEEKTTRLVHYTSKGSETHMTRLPKEAFADLLPASFLVMGRLSKGDEYAYECITVDSDSDDAALLAEIFELGADFLIGEFVPADVRAIEHDRILDFVEQVIQSWLAGTIEQFARENAAMPSTAQLAEMAQDTFRKKHGIDRIDPFSLENPGDALREISRSIEWDLFREYQRRERSVALVRIVIGDEPVKIDVSDVIRKLVDELPRIDALMLSASQQRKSRAGYSYEHHIEAMLAGGNIPFEKQVIIEARKRPDFILPSLAFIDGDDKHASTGLILSAKTTLRERWKQVEREKKNRSLFLTTVDENIAGNAIEDMASIGVHLIIPETLKKAKETEYSDHNNVLTFREFCDQVVAPNIPIWKS